jgi:hypothetical protein
MALPHTAATVCTQFGCPPHTQNCTPATICTLHGHCPPGGQQTHFLCTQGVATFCGCTPGIDCNAPPGNVQTQAPICTQGFPTFCGCTPGIVCDLQRAAAVMQPTPTVQTHCFICPPHTQNCTPATVCTHAVHCPTQPVVCDTMITPTPATRCFICPPLNQTPATVCPTHQIFCPTQPVVCNLQPTQPAVCGVLPPSFGCTQGCNQRVAQPHPQAMMAAAAQPHPQASPYPWCQPHFSETMCPSRIGECFPTTLAAFQFGGAATDTMCVTVRCTFTPVPNGVFTPFGR